MIEGKAFVAYPPKSGTLQVRKNRIAIQILKTPAKVPVLAFRGSSNRGQIRQPT